MSERYAASARYLRTYATPDRGLSLVSPPRPCRRLRARYTNSRAATVRPAPETASVQSRGDKPEAVAAAVANWMDSVMFCPVTLITPDGGVEV